MSRKLTPWLIALAAVAMTAGTAATATADPVHDPVPIGPNQHFEGLVNGNTDHGIIFTEHCVKTLLGFQAQPAPGQYVSAVRDAASDGFTGNAAHEIDVNIPGSNEVVHPPVVLHSYYVPTPIPVSMAVPCTGRNQVIFIPAPDKGGVAEGVNVTFEPIPTPR